MNATSSSYRSAATGGLGRKSGSEMFSRGSNRDGRRGDASNFYTSGTLSVANGTQELGQNPASLKGKLSNLEETTKAVSDELSLHKKELQILKSEKDTLQQVLKVKAEDLQTTLSNELKRLQEEMHRHFVHQKAEVFRIQTQLNMLKAEKSAVAQTLTTIDHRIRELEDNVGNHAVF